MNNSPGSIVGLTFSFSEKVVDYADQLQAQQRFTMADILFKSGTSVRSNVCEAQAAKHKADFNSKCTLAFREANETAYWLELCKESEDYPSAQSMLDDIKLIIKILGKMISGEGTTPSF